MDFYYVLESLVLRLPKYAFIDCLGILELQTWNTYIALNSNWNGYPALSLRNNFSSLSFEESFLSAKADSLYQVWMLWGYSAPWCARIQHSNATSNFQSHRLQISRGHFFNKLIILIPVQMFILPSLSPQSLLWRHFFYNYFHENSQMIWIFKRQNHWILLDMFFMWCYH